MGNALRPLDRRALAVIGAGLLVALCLGAVAGRSPLIAVGLVVGATIAVVMMCDLTRGVVMFTAATFAEALPAGGGAGGNAAKTGLLALAWVACLARRPVAERRSLLADQRALAVCGLALVAWSALSVAWAQSHSTALLGATRFAQDVILFPILYAGVRRPSHVRWVAAGFVAGALVFTAIGAATASAVDGSRLAGAFGDPNDTAATLTAAAVLAVALGASEQGSAVRRRAAFAAGTVALVGLVATASRGGLVALVATAIVAVAVAGRWRRQALSAAVLGAVLVSGWFVLLAPASSRAHISSLQTPRTTLWMVAGRAIQANPIAGIGGNNFTNAAKKYLIAPGATTRADQIVTTPEPAHNTYLEIWADLGIVGLVLFATVVVLALRAALRAAATLGAAGRHGDELLAKALVVAIVALLAAYFFISYQYSTQLWLLLALAPAALAAARTEVAPTPETSEGPNR
jgi:O-antigen ligase